MSTQYSKKVTGMFPGGSMEVRASEKLIPLITAQIYSDPLSGWRELLSNAYQYATDAAALGASPEIDVIIDMKKRTLELHERDSMGIELADLRRILSNMGKSANTDSTRHGKYGMGMAAASCLSDSPVFEVCARNGDTYAMIKTDAAHYELRDPPPKFEKPGMRILLALKDDVDMKRYGEDKKNFLEYTKELARFWPVRTNIRVLREDKDDKIECVIGRSIKEFVLEHHHEQKNKPGKDFYEVEITGDGYYLYGGYQPSLALHLDRELLVQNMPIEGRILTGLTYCYVNVYDTDKYEPTPDRERMGKKSMERLERDIGRDLAAFMKGAAIGTVQEYLDSPKKYIYSDSETWPEKTRAVMRILDNTVQVHGRKPNSEMIRHLLGRKIVHLQKFEAANITTIYQRMPGAVIIRAKADYNDDFVKAGTKVTGIIDGLEYIAKNKIDKKSTIQGYGTSVKYYKAHEITDEFIKVPRGRNLKELSEAVKGLLNNRVFIQDSRKADNTPAIPLESFIEDLRGDIVNSSSGPITTGQILDDFENMTWFDGIKHSEHSLADFARVIGGVLLDRQTDGAILCRVNLACLLKFGGTLGDTDASNSRAASMLTGDLGIRFTGRWCRDPELGARCMRQIKNIPVREVYAHLLEEYDIHRNIEWDESSPFQMKMLDLDSKCAGLGKAQILQKWIETNQRVSEEKDGIGYAITKAVVKICHNMVLDDDNSRASTLKILLEPIFGKTKVTAIKDDWNRRYRIKFGRGNVQLPEDHVMWRIAKSIGQHGESGIKSLIQDDESTTIII